jgi:hypothetical protein
MRELASQLLAASARALDPQAPDTVLVNENFRTALTRLTGAAGVASLLRRALALAGAEMPGLQSVKVNATTGQLDQHLLSEAAKSRELAAMAVTTQMLERLVTFIGEGITRRVVHEACTDTAREQHSSRKRPHS